MNSGILFFTLLLCGLATNAVVAGKDECDMELIRKLTEKFASKTESDEDYHAMIDDDLTEFHSDDDDDYEDSGEDDDDYHHPNVERHQTRSELEDLKDIITLPEFVINIPVKPISSKNFLTALDVIGSGSAVVGQPPKKKFGHHTENRLPDVIGSGSVVVGQPPKKKWGHHTENTLADITGAGKININIDKIPEGKHNDVIGVGKVTITDGSSPKKNTQDVIGSGSIVIGSPPKKKRAHHTENRLADVIGVGIIDIKEGAPPKKKLIQRLLQCPTLRKFEAFLDWLKESGEV